MGKTLQTPSQLVRPIPRAEDDGYGRAGWLGSVIFQECVLKRVGQVDSHRARKYQGTGLGLPLSKQLAELHGGNLVLESILGTGTTVTVHLPRNRLVTQQGASAVA